MATFRIALVLVCLMAVGATKTCPDGADTETCSQLDSASLIQLPATVVKADVLESKAHTDLGGLAQVAAGAGGIPEHCDTCMDLLKACIESLTAVSTVAAGGSGPGGPAIPDESCDQFKSFLNGDHGVDPASYVQVLCLLGNQQCTPNTPSNCYVQLMAKAMPNFNGFCGAASGSTSYGNSGSGYVGSAPPLLTQQEATRKLEGDVTRTCTHPAKDDPKTWVCPCLSNMKAHCDGAQDVQACMKGLMCDDDRIDGAWKQDNCAAGWTSNCPALLVETNTSMEARAKEARVEASQDANLLESEETDSLATLNDAKASLDDSLSGKRVCEPE